MKRSIALAVTVLLAILAGCFILHSVYEDDAENILCAADMQVHFIDVGQGDATLILCGDESMLIDAGGESCGLNVLRYLEKLGIDRLKYLVLTHSDEDHIGGADIILRRYQVDHVLAYDMSADTECCRRVVELAEPEAAERGLVLNVGEAKCVVLGPDRDHREDNDDSVIIMVENGPYRFLFTGDAERVAERELMEYTSNLKADVYKAGHHGSSSSGCDELLELVRPEYAVISCGSGNEYGHPTERTLQRLERVGAKVYRTDMQGNIIAYIDGNGLHFETVAAGEQESDVSYICNRRSGKYHRIDCEAVLEMSEHNRLDVDMSEAELRSMGYEPCGICGK